MGVIVLDTTVLLYAVGGEHPLQEPCIRFLDRVRARAVESTTTVEVIQEFVHVRSRRRSRSDAVGLARSFARLLAPLVSPTTNDLADGLAIFEAHPTLGAFDSILAATAVRRDADALLSADRAFVGVPGLRYVAPGTAKFEALLG